MKNFFKYILTTLALFVVLFVGIVLGILKCNPGTFYTHYNNLIVDKYRMLQRTNEPKIIMVAGSSSAFGLDQKMLEEATGYKVVNLGLHAGFGHLFYSELSKENINQGDIVLLGYEYNWPEDFESLSQELIMPGIDDNIDMYKHIPVSRWKDFVGYIFSYASLKSTFTGAHGIYSRDAFDEISTQMIMHREYDMNYDENPDAYGKIDLTDVTISEASLSYLRDYRDYVYSKGAKVYFVAPPLFYKVVGCDYAWFQVLKQLEEEEIGIPYISNPEDYFFDEELISNGKYHCSNEGEKVRTKLLISDLKNASVID